MLARHQHAVAYALAEASPDVTEEQTWAAALQRIALGDDRFQRGSLAADLLVGLRGKSAGVELALARRAYQLWLQRTSMQCQAETGHPSFGHSVPLQDPASASVPDVEGGMRRARSSGHSWMLEGVNIAHWKPWPPPERNSSVDWLVAAEMREGLLGVLGREGARGAMRMLHQADEHLCDAEQLRSARSVTLARQLEPAQLATCHQALQNASALPHMHQP
jgi:hypothetical protein